MACNDWAKCRKFCLPSLNRLSVCFRNTADLVAPSHLRADLGPPHLGLLLDFSLIPLLSFFFRPFPDRSHSHFVPHCEISSDRVVQNAFFSWEWPREWSLAFCRGLRFLCDPVASPSRLPPLSIFSRGRRSVVPAFWRGATALTFLYLLVQRLAPQL